MTSMRSVIYREVQRQLEGMERTGEEWTGLYCAECDHEITVDEEKRQRCDACGYEFTDDDHDKMIAF